MIPALRQKHNRAKTDRHGRDQSKTDASCPTTLFFFWQIRRGSQGAAMRTTVPRSVSLTPSQPRWLDEKAARLSVSVGKLVRRIIDARREKEASQ